MGRVAAWSPSVSMTWVARGRRRIDQIALRRDPLARRHPRRHPAPTRRSQLDIRIAGDEPDLVAQVGEPALDELDRLDHHGPGACPLRALERREDARPDRGMDDRLQVAQRAADPLKTMRPSAARSSSPSGRRRSCAEPRDRRPRPRACPAASTSRATRSASMTTRPDRSPSQRATVDLPHPIGPVIPICHRHGARSSSSQPRVLGDRQRAVDVGQLARDAPHLDEVRRHRRIAHRQLEMTLAQPQPRQLRIQRRLLLPIRILRQLLQLPPGRAGRDGGAIAIAGQRRGRVDGGTSRRRQRAGDARGAVLARPAARYRFPRSATPLCDGPPVGHGRAPRPIPTIECRRRPSPTTHSGSHTVSSNRRSCETTSNVAGESRMNASIASRAGMSRWFVGSSSSSRFDGWMPEQRELEPRALAARQRADLLERVVAAEQEPGQVGARLTGRHRDRVEQRIEHGRARDRRAAELGEVAELDGIAERQRAIERRQVAGDRPQERGLAGAVRPDDADPIAALRGQERHAGHDLRLGRGFAVRPRRHLDPGGSRSPGPRCARRSHPTATARHRRAHSAAASSRRPVRGASRRSACSRSSRASCSCIFENLRWLR